MVTGNLALAAPDYYFTYVLDSVDFDACRNARAQYSRRRRRVQMAQTRDWRATCAEALAARLHTLPEGPFVQGRRWA